MCYPDIGKPCFDADHTIRRFLQILVNFLLTYQRLHRFTVSKQSNGVIFLNKNITGSFVVSANAKFNIILEVFPFDHYIELPRVIVSLWVTLQVRTFQQRVIQIFILFQSIFQMASTVSLPFTKKIICAMQTFLKCPFRFKL